MPHLAVGQLVRDGGDVGPLLWVKRPIGHPRASIQQQMHKCTRSALLLLPVGGWGSKGGKGGKRALLQPVGAPLARTLPLHNLSWVCSFKALCCASAVPLLSLLGTARSGAQNATGHNYPPPPPGHPRHTIPPQTPARSGSTVPADGVLNVLRDGLHPVLSVAVGGVGAGHLLHLQQEGSGQGREEGSEPRRAGTQGWPVGRRRAMRCRSTPCSRQLECEKGAHRTARCRTVPT